MKYVDMHRQFRSGCHDCAPKAWHVVPKVTGDYDLDATIGHSANKDMQKKLSMYVNRGNSAGYGPKTGYDRYARGDD